LGDLAPDSPQRLAPLALDWSGPATDVFLRDPAAGASTPYRREVHSQFLGDPPDERGRLHLLRRGRGCLAVGADENERRANRNELALGHEDLRHLAGSRRGDLDRRLVGLDLDEGVVLGDVLPDLHKPARDLPLPHTLAQVGKLELVGHQKERTCRRASTTRAGEGMCSSSSDQKGKGASYPVTRSTGPRRSRMAFSAKSAAISAPKPATRGASCTMTARPVLPTEARRVSSSSGLRERTSMTSTLASTSPAACSATPTIPP